MDHSMSRNEWITFNHDRKRFKSLANSRFYCYCGHSVILNPKDTRVLCTHCGHWVYKDKRKQRNNIKKIQLEEQEKLKKLKMEYFKNKVREVLENENITR